MKQVDISAVKKNPTNPRFIKNDKFKKLVQSIKDFPKMLEIRPIVVNKEMVILGGNMRFEACKQAGLQKVWIKIADELTKEEQQEFIIKDNSSFGEWDWDVLANEWDKEQLEEWGLDLPVLNDKAEVEEPEIEFSEYLDESHNYVVLTFDNDIDWLSAQTHFKLKSVYSKRQNGKPWSKGVGRVVNGAEYLKNLKDE
tara:strand:+ start:26531 stop:27121 length:591 start_codon:yes stop_codon:yes gene_type:complete